MFSFYRHDQQLKDTAKLQERAHSENTLRKRHLKTREKLTRKYDQRMDNNLLQLIDEAPPLPKPDTSVSMRSFLQSQGIHSDKERVQVAIERNSWLDHASSQHRAFKLRPRTKTKEICGPYSRKPKTGMGRLKELLEYQRQLYDTSLSPTDPNKNWHKTTSGFEKHRFQSGKEVHQYYHFKTNFKTIEHYTILGRPNSKVDRPEISKSILERFRLKSVQRTR